MQRRNLNKKLLQPGNNIEKWLESSRRRMSGAHQVKKVINNVNFMPVMPEKFILRLTFFYVPTTYVYY